MSFLPSTGSLGPIDQAIQAGRGAAAAVIGQTYNVYRLTSSTNNGVVGGTPTLTNFPARVIRTTSGREVENTAFANLVYAATCDNRPLVLGDVLEENGYESTGSHFTYIQQRPTRTTLFIRTEFNVTITRPTPTAGQAAQQPTSGAIATTGYAGFQKSSEQILTLTNGFYSFQNSGTPAQVQVGLQPYPRMKDARVGLPTALYREEFSIYLPLLPGTQLNELDRINFPNSDRYELAIIYSTGSVGAYGYFTKAEKLAT